ncbi:hypothetical protein [Vampirovibrio sp.]|uniref:hypothetical protein n=1 Tax=Vampirovibrio sp. TaxID=2717857 RepID=UPI00359473D1
MTLKRIAVLFSALSILLASAVLPVQAKWFAKKIPPENDPVQQVQTFQPPPENAMTLYCDPFRKEVAVLNQKSWVHKPFSLPRRLWLMNEYKECTNELMTQEHQYLKHADIELPPSLPKMKPVVQPINQPEVKQEAPNGNL